MLSGIVDYKLEMEPNNALKTAKKPQLEKMLLKFRSCSPKTWLKKA